MAGCSSGGDLLSSVGLVRDELKSQFSTREGVYRLVSSVELSRSTRPPPSSISYGTISTQPSSSSQGPTPPLRISLISTSSSSSSSSSPPHPPPPQNSNNTPPHNANSPQYANSPQNPSLSPSTPSSIPPANSPENSEETPRTSSTSFCFNLGKELFVYSYLGNQKIADLSKPVDKRIYKGTYPTCHEFNPSSASQESLSLLIGFSGGQIQLVDPVSKELNKLFNEDRLIDKSRVSCVRWVPSSPSSFLVSHGSGSMYLYNTDLNCPSTPPSYSLIKQGVGYSVSTLKSKTPRNPLTKWTLASGAINEFAFSPCGLFIATVSQDGLLRILRYETYELEGLTRSYFGGLTCVCWSPDSKYVCVGGEDDLVTIWSFKERRVVARGQGHRSWVSVVAFDPYTTTYGESEETEESEHGTRTEKNEPKSGGNSAHHHETSSKSRHSRNQESVNLRLSISESSASRLPACYRVGSVSQDTQLCLWDLTEDILKQPWGKTRPSSVRNPIEYPSPLVSSTSPHTTKHLNGNCSPPTTTTNSSFSNYGEGSSIKETKGRPPENGSTSNHSSSNSSHGLLSLRFGPIGFGSSDKGTESKREHKRNFSLVSSTPKSDSKLLASTATDDPLKLIGTEVCPRLDECPLLEPLITKKISHERLTVLLFCQNDILTACQEGVLCTWARPSAEECRIPNKKRGNMAQDDVDIYQKLFSRSTHESVEPL